MPTAPSESVGTRARESIESDKPNLAKEYFVDRPTQPKHQALAASFCATTERYSIISSVRSMTSILLSGFSSAVGCFSVLMSSVIARLLVVVTIFKIISWLTWFLRR